MLIWLEAFLKMILLKISNSSELVASKLGSFVERLTPDLIDQSTVEDLVVKKMIENLVQEGVKGEISVVSGIELVEGKLSLSQGFKVHNHQSL